MWQADRYIMNKIIITNYEYISNELIQGIYLFRSYHFIYLFNLIFAKYIGIILFKIELDDCVSRVFFAVDPYNFINLLSLTWHEWEKRLVRNFSKYNS